MFIWYAPFLYIKFFSFILIIWRELGIKIDKICESYYYEVYILKKRL